MNMRSTLIALLCLFTLLAGGPVRADSAEQIRRGAGDALVFLRENIDGAGVVLDNAAGVLVFPDVVKLGFGVGGEYGEGVLLVAGQPAGFYATSGASFGLPLGSGIKSEVVVFVTEAALQAFLERRSWQVGEGGLVLANAPMPAGPEGMVGYIFAETGLLPGLTLDGAKITRLAR
jgi:lipid-binding SYLF domain-containing protein